MKKFIAGIVLVCLACLPVFASGFKFHFGPVFTNLNYTESYDPYKKSALFQWTGGLGFEINFTTNIVLELDVMYAPGGAKFKANFGGDEHRATYKGYAVSVPVLLKVTFLPGTTPFVVGGGALAYTLSHKFRYEDPGGTFEQDLTDEANRVQYSVMFGGGVELSIGTMDICLEGRYSLGLSNLIKEPWGDEKLTTQNIYILLSYMF